MRLTFGEFVFDSGSRELLRHQRPLTLSPKAFQLLEVLIENRPNALSKSALHDLLWPNTFVVEANLSNLIGEIRHALGDQPRAPRFIRTVHRFGYAFNWQTVGTPDDSPVLCRVAWEGGSVLLSEGEHIIGRDLDAAVVIDSPSVSRCHARIQIDHDQATFEDLGSKNGSAVGGRPAQGPIVLTDGDVITVGVVNLTFRRRPALLTESVR